MYTTILKQPVAGFFLTVRRRRNSLLGLLAISFAAWSAWVARFVHWYNREHRHSAIRFITPEQRHRGLDTTLLAQRQAVYEAARARAPHRWAGPLRNWSRIDVVHLNPDKNPVEIASAENNLRRAA